MKAHICTHDPSSREGILLLAKGLDQGYCGKAAKACLALGLLSTATLLQRYQQCCQSNLEHIKLDCLILGSTINIHRQHSKTEAIKGFSGVQ